MNFISFHLGSTCWIGNSCWVTVAIIHISGLNNETKIIIKVGLLEKYKCLIHMNKIGSSAIGVVKEIFMYFCKVKLASNRHRKKFFRDA